MDRKIIKYKSNSIIRTNSTTSVLVPMPGGSSGYYRAVRYLYRIDGPNSRKEGQRPFLTSVAACRDFINQSINQLTEHEKCSLLVFFDNSGGITLQTEAYCHFYSDPKQAAVDVSAILAGESTLFWDGNQPKSRLVESETEHDLDDILAIKSKPYRKERHGGYAEAEFYHTLLTGLQS